MDWRYEREDTSTQRNSIDMLVETKCSADRDIITLLFFTSTIFVIATIIIILLHYMYCLHVYVFQKLASFYFSFILCHSKN